MTDACAFVLFVLAAGCATLATGHWTSAGRITAPAGGLIDDQHLLRAHRRLLDVVGGRETDCVQRCACTLRSPPLWVDAPLQWGFTWQPTFFTLNCVRAQLRQPLREMQFAQPLHGVRAAVPFRAVQGSLRCACARAVALALHSYRDIVHGLV